MFSRLATLLPVAALAVVATAAPNALEARNDCSSGSEYCCNQVFSSPTYFTGILGGLLTAIADVGVPIGLTCDPITVIGLGTGGTCTIQTACCSNNVQNGLVNVECVPIAVSA